jgi:hypothetical protein
MGTVSLGPSSSIALVNKDMTISTCGQDLAGTLSIEPVLSGRKADNDTHGLALAGERDHLCNQSGPVPTGRHGMLNSVIFLTVLKLSF